MGKPKSKVVDAIVPGPLGQYAPGFRSWLLALAQFADLRKIDSRIAPKIGHSRGRNENRRSQDAL